MPPIPTLHFTFIVTRAIAQILLRAVILLIDTSLTYFHLFTLTMSIHSTYQSDHHQRDRSRSPRRRSRSPRSRRRSYSPRSRSHSRNNDDYRRDSRRSRSPMSGAGNASGGYAGSGYGGRGGGPPRSFEDRAAAKEQMMASVRESSQQDRRVYVGNLAYDVKWHHLKDFMRQGSCCFFFNTPHTDDPV